MTALTAIWLTLAEVGVINMTDTTQSSMPIEQGMRRLLDAVEVATVSSTTAEIVKRGPSSMGHDNMCRHPGYALHHCLTREA